MATLAGNTIASTYPLLLKIDSSGIDGTLRAVEDGDGTDSALSIATDSVLVKGDGVKLYFYDADGGEHISANTGGVLSIAGASEIDLTATAIDINGTVDMSSTLAVGGDVTISASASTKPHFTITNTHGDGSAPQFIMKKDSASPADDDEVGRIYMYGDDDAGNPFESILIRGITTDVSNGGEDSRLEFLTYKAGAQVSTLALDSGAVGIGIASPGYALDILNSTTPQLNISNTASDNTAKFSQITTAHYDNEQEPMTMIEGRSDGSQNYVRLGGGRSEGNSMTILEGYFGSSINETGGTKKFSFDESNGYFLQNIGIGETAPSSQLVLKDGQSDAISDLDTGGIGLRWNGADGTFYGLVAMDSGSRTYNSGFIGFEGHDSGSAGSRSIVFATKSGTGDSAVAKRMEILGNGTVAITQTGADIGLSINHDADAPALSIDAESTTANVIVVNADPTTDGNVIDITADNLEDGRILKLMSDSDDNSGRYLVYVQNDHPSAEECRVGYFQQDANAINSEFKSANGSFTDSTVYIPVERSATDAFNFIRTFSTGDTQHALRGNGELDADGAYSSAGADYAEYFESKDGKAITVGVTVKLDGDKVVACEDGDTPIGVVRPNSNSVIIGNSAPLKWTGKYLKDDYGAYIKEEYTLTEWIDGKKEDGANNDISYHTDKIPSDVTVPSDAVVISKDGNGNQLMRYKLNPDYDESKTYNPRKERDEWCLIGLLGQIPITKGQPMASSWIKMKDVSDTVEMWMVK